jgi:hypothetical protein
VPRRSAKYRLIETEDLRRACEPVPDRGQRREHGAEEDERTYPRKRCASPRCSRADEDRRVGGPAQGLDRGSARVEREAGPARGIELTEGEQGARPDIGVGEARRRGGARRAAAPPAERGSERQRAERPRRQRQRRRGARPGRGEPCVDLQRERAQDEERHHEQARRCAPLPTASTDPDDGEGEQERPDLPARSPALERAIVGAILRSRRPRWRARLASDSVRRTGRLARARWAIGSSTLSDNRPVRSAPA